MSKRNVEEYKDLNRNPIPNCGMAVGLVNEHSFDDWKANAVTGTASASRIVANSTFYKTSDGYLVDKNDSTRRWIDLFINPAIRPKKLKKRDFTSFDIAPSILESMGFDVDGHRMGFGVSLFSEEATLLEKYGLNELNDGMLQVKKSTEYKNLNGI